MKKIFVPDYWPLFKTDELRRFDYTAADDSMPPITAVFAYDRTTDSMLYVDYDAHLNWKDTWFYKYKPGFGISEWRDDYPGGKKVVMSPAIGWGEYAEIGGSYVNKPQMSPLQSWPPAMSKGVQIVAYENLLSQFRTVSGVMHKDVLVMTYMQAWSGKPAGGARYWMAKGVGPVAVQWMAQDPRDVTKPLITTSRMDAVVSSVNSLAA